MSAPADTAPETGAPDLYVYRAVVTKVYDGDTVTVDLDLGLGTWQRGLKLRLHGIDTPELRADDPAPGRAARDFLRARVLDREVVVRTVKDRTGKYGRLLAELYVDGASVNDELVAAGHARPYDGGART